MNRCLAPFLAVLLLSAQADAQEQIPLLSAVWEALSSENATDESVAEALATLGNDAVPALCAALAGLRSDEKPSLRPRPDESDTRRLEVALARCDRPTLLQHVKSLVEADPAARTRVHAIRLLSLRGTADDVEQLLEVAGKIDMAHLRSPWIERHLKSAFRALMARDPKTLTVLARAWKKLGPLRKPIAGAAGEDGSEASFRFLTETLRHELDGHALRALSNLVKSRPTTLRPSTSRLLERFLQMDEVLSADVADLLSATRCCETATSLIPLLDSKDVRVRRASHAALQNLTGVRRPADRSSWESYFEAERRWFREDFHGLARALRSGEAVRTVESLKALRGHRLHADAIIEVALPLLYRDADDAVAALVIDVLESTNSLAVVPELLEALSIDSTPLRRRAHGALCRLLGKDVGAESTAWRDAFPHLCR